MPIHWNKDEESQWFPVKWKCKNLPATKFVFSMQCRLWLTFLPGVLVLCQLTELIFPRREHELRLLFLLRRPFLYWKIDRKQRTTDVWPFINFQQSTTSDYLTTTTSHQHVKAARERKPEARLSSVTDRKKKKGRVFYFFSPEKWSI